MTVESPGFANQGSSYGAEITRRAIGSLLARGSGVGTISGGLVNASDMQISAGGGMSVNVSTGECWVPGSSGATQGGYYGRVSSSTNLPIAASNPTNPRIDSVSATVTDAAYGQASDTFAVQVNTGTPTAGATLSNLSGAPTLPASSLLLGYVLVPAGSSSVSSGSLSNTAMQISLGSVHVVATGQVYGGASQVATNTHTPITGLTITTPALTPSQVLSVWFLPVLLASSNTVSASLTLNGVETGVTISVGSNNVTFPSTIVRETGLSGSQTLGANIWATSSAGGTSANASQIFYEITNA